MAKRAVYGMIAGLGLLAAGVAAALGTADAPALPAGGPATASGPRITAMFDTLTAAGAAQPGAPVAAAATAAPIRHDVAVTVVDPNADQRPNKVSGVPNRHLALVPAQRADRKGRLFVFVGGTNSTETITQEIMFAGARRGYHSLAVAYPNYDAVVPLCLASTDDECTAKVRGEILTGADLTPLVTIAYRDAFETRLRTTLAYLARTYPGEGWGRYLAGGGVDWAKVSAVGHSQGAGHVALLAKSHAMFRSVMISGVADLTATGQPAPWLSRPSQTPLERQYGFTHVADYVVPLPVANASWDAIGLGTFGALQQTDGRSPPYAGSHKLITALLPAKGTNPHVAMLHDAQMPRAPNGTPAHRPVWDFTAFPE